MSEMVERIARGMYERRPYYKSRGVYAADRVMFCGAQYDEAVPASWDDAPEYVRQGLLAIARAALEAMKEPMGDAVATAAWRAWYDAEPATDTEHRNAARRVVAAMIAAALEPKPITATHEERT